MAMPGTEITIANVNNVLLEDITGDRKAVRKLKEKLLEYDDFNALLGGLT